MLFNSLDYLLFLPLVVVLCYVLPGVRLRNIFLLIASYFFYMNWNAAYALLLLGSTLVTYAGARILDKLPAEAPKKRKLCLAVCLVLNLSVLCVFKYAGMLENGLNGLAGLFHLPSVSFGLDLLLPVGISFYTLQALGYLIDVYRGDVPCERDIVTYALFVSFFPQLVAGPIERSKNLLGQLKEKKKFRYKYFQKGLFLVLYGLLVKMAIADNLAVIVDLVYKDPSRYSGWYIVFATFCFAIQIYCDFYGYSVIAKGSACLIGIELMSNFEAPYLSGSVHEFWRRWHISLSTWFRDYLYIPLGGNRKGGVRKSLNLLTVFLVSGLWHGASGAFVLWGFLNGLCQVLGSLFQRFFRRGPGRKPSGAGRVLRTVFTFCLVTFTWIFFRAGDRASSKRILSSLFGGLRDLSFFKLSVLKGFLHDTVDFTYTTLFGIALCILLLFAIDLIRYRGVPVTEKLITQPLWFRYVAYFVLLILLLVVGAYGSSYGAHQFIYFQF